MKNLLILLILGCTTNYYGQKAEPCLQEVLEYERRTGDLNDTAIEKKNVYLSYTVKATNWDDESSISNVKIYKMGEETRLFSEQANMFTNKKEIIVEMPSQKVIVVNDALKEMNEMRNMDEFQQLRKNFLDSCQVVKCESIGKNTKVLVLKVKPGQLLDTKILEIKYEYDTELKKLLSVKTNYRSDYKLKTVLIIYREFNTESTYKFSAFKSQFIDKKGRLTEKYRDYELVDNREKNSGSSKQGK